jgi:sialic acid synthase SpsE
MDEMALSQAQDSDQGKLDEATEKYVKLYQEHEMNATRSLAILKALKRGQTATREDWEWGERVKKGKRTRSYHILVGLILTLAIAEMGVLATFFSGSASVIPGFAAIALSLGILIIGTLLEIVH